MSLSTRILQAQSLLAPYAVPIAGRLGRAVSEEPDEARYPFQRDRDRIIHTDAFRRLKGKTQVFIASKHDHHRTRLTHTLEVTQISRDIARTLRLNEDLAECIALAHDLGHPPFGHAGEQALDLWMQEHGETFEHNAQSHRIVTVLAHHSTKFPGLNLNKEVLEGLLKHQTVYDHPSTDIVVTPTLEAQLVNIADEIAYTGHDCEDGLRSGILQMDDLQQSSLCQRAVELSKQRGSSLRGGIVHLLISDLYEESERRLSKIASLEDVFRSIGPLISFSNSLQAELKELRSILQTKLYFFPAVKEENARGKEIVIALCASYLQSPTEKVLMLQSKHKSSLPEAIKDYVSGMSDQYAMTTCENMLRPKSKRTTNFSIS